MRRVGLLLAVAAADTCDTHSCPEGMQRSIDAASVDCGGVCSDQQCCVHLEYHLKNVDPAFRGFDPSVSYTEEASLECAEEHRIPAPFNDNEQMRLAQCFYNCTVSAEGQAAPGCEAAVADGASSGHAAVCVDAGEDAAAAELLQELCNQIQDCYAVTYMTGKFYGYLYSSSCRDTVLGTSDGTSYVRSVFSVASCTLGIGAVLSGTTHSALLGLYERVDSSCDPAGADLTVAADGSYYGPSASCSSYRQLGTDQPNYINWHESGCGWVVLQHQPAAVAQDPAARVCMDHVAVANVALHTTLVDYDAMVCGKGQQIGYCNNVIFARICAATCAVPSVGEESCHLDNDVSAAEYGKLINNPLLATCVDLQAAHCDDAAGIVRTLCPESCPAADQRRLSLPAFGDAFRMTLRRLSKQRQLGFDGDVVVGERFLEAYYTWDPTVVPATGEVPGCTPAAAADPARVDDGRMGLWDVRPYHTQVDGLSASLSCPVSIKFAHVFGRYCQHKNNDAHFSNYGSVVRNSCTRKCGAVHVNGQITDAYGVVHEEGWCAGNNPELGRDANALCVPREQCEAICVEMGADCHSIEMHRLFPRCYLNTAECEDTSFHVVHDEWDIMVKAHDLSDETPTELATVISDGDSLADTGVDTVTILSSFSDGSLFTADELRDTYTTHTGMECLVDLPDADDRRRMTCTDPYMEDGSLSVDPLDGAPCVFPFLYKNEAGVTREYTGCTEEDNNGVLWCFTETEPGPTSKKRACRPCIATLGPYANVSAVDQASEAGSEEVTRAQCELACSLDAQCFGFSMEYTTCAAADTTTTTEAPAPPAVQCNDAAAGFVPASDTASADTMPRCTGDQTVSDTAMCMGALCEAADAAACCVSPMCSSKFKAGVGAEYVMTTGLEIECKEGQVVSTTHSCAGPSCTMDDAGTGLDGCCQNPTCGTSVYGYLQDGVNPPGSDGMPRCAPGQSVDSDRQCASARCSDMDRGSGAVGDGCCLNSMCSDADFGFVASSVVLEADSTNQQCQGDQSITSFQCAGAVCALSDADTCCDNPTCHGPAGFTVFIPVESIIPTGANLVTVLAPAHGLSDGDLVVVENVAGNGWDEETRMPSGKVHTVIFVDFDEFQLAVSTVDVAADTPLLPAEVDDTTYAAIAGKQVCDAYKAVGPTDAECAGPTCSAVTDQDTCCVEVAMTCARGFKEDDGAGPVSGDNREPCAVGQTVRTGSCETSSCAASDSGFCCQNQACAVGFRLFLDESRDPSPTLACELGQTLSPSFCGTQQCSETDRVDCCQNSLCGDPVYGFQRFDGTAPDLARCPEGFGVADAVTCATGVCSIADEGLCCVPESTVSTTTTLYSLPADAVSTTIAGHFAASGCSPKGTCRKWGSECDGNLEPILGRDQRVHFAVKNKHLPCTVTLEGSNHDCAAAGTYVKLERECTMLDAVAMGSTDTSSTRGVMDPRRPCISADLETVFLHPTNRSRIAWVPLIGDPSAVQCNGWHLQCIDESRATESVDFFTCQDQEAVALEYLGMQLTAEQIPQFRAGEACVWAARSGYCEDKILAAICAFSCSPMKSQTIAGTSYQWQDREMGTCSSCHGDNNDAFAEWLNLRRHVDPFTTTTTTTPPPAPEPAPQLCSAAFGVSLSCAAGQTVNPTAECATGACEQSDSVACCVNQACEAFFEEADGSTTGFQKCPDEFMVSVGQICPGSLCLADDDAICCRRKPQRCDGPLGFQLVDGTDVQKHTCVQGQTISDTARCAQEDCDEQDRTTCCVNPTCVSAFDTGLDGSLACTTGKTVTTDPEKRCVCTDGAANCECAEDDEPVCCDSITCVAGYTWCASEQTIHSTAACGVGEADGVGECDETRDKETCCVNPKCSDPDFGFQVSTGVSTKLQLCAEGQTVSQVARCSDGKCVEADAVQCCLNPVCHNSFAPYVGAPQSELDGPGPTPDDTGARCARGQIVKYHAVEVGQPASIGTQTEFFSSFHPFRVGDSVILTNMFIDPAMDPHMLHTESLLRESGYPVASVTEHTFTVDFDSDVVTIVLENFPTATRMARCAGGACDEAADQATCCLATCGDYDVGYAEFGSLWLTADEQAARACASADLMVNPDGICMGAVCAVDDADTCCVARPAASTTMAPPDSIIPVCEACSSLLSTDTYAAFGFTDWSNNTHSMCHFHAYSSIHSALCKETCANADLPGTQPTAPPTDEATPTGATDRRLQAAITATWLETALESTEHWTYVARTFSNGTHDATHQLVYLGESQLPTCLDLLGDSALQVTDSLPAFPSAYSFLNSASWYRWSVARDDTVSLQSVCLDASHCPALSTCVLAPARFAEEMNVWRRAGCTENCVADAQFLSQSDAPVRCPVLGAEHFVPKVLVSESRVEALISVKKWAFGREIFRNDPTATKVRLLDGGDAADKVIITMVDPLEADGAVAAQQLGKSYGSKPSEHWQDWQTDVIRIERFGADCAVLEDGTFSFVVYAPGVTRLRMFRIARNDAVGDTPQFIDVEQEGGSITMPEGVGYFTVTVTRVNADFVGTEDLYECASQNGRSGQTQYCDPDPTKADCTEVVGGPPVCTCRAENGYSGDGAACSLKPNFYDEMVRAQYFRLEHKDRLDYGWRVAEVKMYKDLACSEEVVYDAGSCATEVMSGEDPLPALAGNVVGMVTLEKSGADPTVEDGGDVNALCSVKVRGTYPHVDNAGVAGLFDGDTATHWWSECLNCNPEVVDGTRGSAAFLEWYIRAKERVMCVELVQAEGHATTEFSVVAGPLVGEGCSYATTLCEPTQSWSFPQNSAVPEGAVTDAGLVTSKVHTACGVADTQIFGEVLSAPVGGTSGDGSLHFGSYAPTGVHARDAATGVPAFRKTVPSACHCQQLCADHILDGCRSYKYLDESAGTSVKHCYLQSTPFSMEGVGRWGVTVGTGPGDWPGWTSGGPGLRLSGLTAQPSGMTTDGVTTVPAGQQFNLTVHGVSLPYSDSRAADKSSRQRIKIVYAEGTCADPIPAEIKGIGCSTTKRQVSAAKEAAQVGSRDKTVYLHCSPRPAAATAEQATFRGLQIAATQTSQIYKVCYCAGSCFEDGAWHEVSQRLMVSSSSYTWMTTPAAPILRKTDTNALTVTITRPPFTAYSDPATWALRVVRHYYDCETYHFHDGFQCQNQAGNTDLYQCNPDTGTVTSDSASWSMLLDLKHTVDATDVGLYKVCFREAGATVWHEIPSAMSDRTMMLEVLMIPEDRSNPRGIFHNQFFTALEGATSTITVAGTRLLVPTTSKVVLNAHPDRVCGSNEKFFFVPGDAAAVTDVTPPVLLPQQSVPVHGGDIGQKMTIMLTFNENIQKGAGNLVLTPDTDPQSPVIMDVRNPFVIFAANKIIFTPKRSTGTRGSLTPNPVTGVISHWDLEDGNDLEVSPFTLQTSQAGVVMDTAQTPNQVSQIDTTSYWKFNVATTAKPHVLRTEPAHDQHMVSPDGAVIAIQFSEYVTLNGDGVQRLFQVVDCGNDQDCSTLGDNLANNVDVSEIVVAAEGDTTQACTMTITNFNAADTTNEFFFNQGQPPRLLKHNEAQLGANGQDILITEAQISANPLRGCDLGDGYKSNPFTTFCFDGSDMHVPCADGGTQASYEGVNYGYVYFLPRSLLVADRRYMVQMPAGAVVAGTETNDAFQFEFFTGEYTKFRREYAFSVDETASSSEGLVYHVALGANLIDRNEIDGQKMFKYAVCYCDENVDAASSDGTVEGTSSVFDAEDGATTYLLSDASRCGRPESGDIFIPQSRMLTSYQTHICSDKCDKGCTGPDCYCDGNRDEALAAVADPSKQRLCLPPTMCRAACDEHSSLNQVWADQRANAAAGSTPFACVGIDVHQGSNACYLIGNSDAHVAGSTPVCLEGALAVDEEYIHLEKLLGSACTHASDFSEYAGLLSVTRRVQIGVDYVLEPSADTSLEVSHANGRSLTLTGLGGLTADRITVVDCKGYCGLSAPSSAVSMPENASSIETWNNFWAVSYYVDPAHEDTKNPAATQAVASGPAEPRSYSRRENTYCSNRNLDLETTFLQMDGTLKSLQEHQCYTKCSKNSPYLGTDGACGGHFSGFDGPDSNAICMSTEELASVCDQIEGCMSFDSHRTLSRGFLNVAAADGTVCTEENLEDSADYDWYRVETTTDAATGTEPRRVQAVSELAFAFSWPQLLRWRDIRFATGGTFKLCFCDSEHLVGSACRNAADYSVEVGTVHVSGVSCLIADPRFQRVACSSQYYGGLRCYKGAQPVLDPSSEIQAAPLAASTLLDNQETIQLLSTWCSFGPEEQTANDPRCELVAAFQSTAAGAAAR